MRSLRNVTAFVYKYIFKDNEDTLSDDHSYKSFLKTYVIISFYFRLPHLILIQIVYCT